MAENRTEQMEEEEELFDVCMHGKKNPHKGKTPTKCRRQYYQLGMMARVTAETTYAELLHLLKHDTRTFLLSQNFEYKLDYNDIINRTKQAIQEYEGTSPILHSLAFEFRGDGCHFGRIHNNCTIFLLHGDIITLTDNPKYENSCFKEIAYASNIKFYLPTLKLNDIINIGNEVYGIVVKILKHNLAIFILQSGIIHSYEYINLPKQCYLMRTNHEYGMFEDDLIISQTINADFFVIPRIRNISYLKALRRYCNEEKHVKIIGKLDYEYMMTVAPQLENYLSLLDFLFLPDAVQNIVMCSKYIFSRVLPQAIKLGLPIIGKIPIETCCDFEKYKDHKFAKSLDSYYLDKSNICKKYPLVVKHILPVPLANLKAPINMISMKFPMEQLKDTITYMIDIASTINYRLIILNTSPRDELLLFTEKSITCPIYVMLPLDSAKDSETQIKNTQNQLFAKSLNLYRNLKGIVYNEAMNDLKLSPIEFGVEYARKSGILCICDALLILNEKKEDGQDENFNAGDSSLSLQSCFVLPSSD